MRTQLKDIAGRAEGTDLEVLNILVVDDVKEVSRFMKDLLARDAPHFSVASVESGLECLGYIKENYVDCILSDYQMPGMDGMELLRILRAQGLDIPLIFVTGQGSEAVAREAFKNGAYDYFARDASPGQSARIINSVEQAVRQRLAERLKRKAEDALRSQKEFSEALLNTAQVLILVLDPLGRIVSFNNECRRVTGYAQEEALGRPPWEFLVPPAISAEAKDSFTGLLSGKGSVFCETPWVTRSGEKHIISWSSSFLNGPEGGMQYVIQTGVDITDKRADEIALINRNHDLTRINIENAMLIQDLKKKEASLKSRYQQLAALNSVAEIIAGSQSLEEMLSQVLEKTLSLPFLDIERKGVVFLRDEKDPDRLNMAAHIGIAPELVALESRIRVGRCLCGRAALTGKMIKSKDCFTDPSHTTSYAGMKKHGHVVFPIKSKERVLGVMTFYLSPGVEASQTEERILSAVASQLAVAIENHRLFEKISAGKKEWEETFDAMAELVAVNGPDLSIIRANKAVARTLGLDVSRIAGRNWFDVFLPDGTKDIVGDIVDKLRAGAQCTDCGFEGPFTTAAGEQRIISWRFEPVLDGRGRVHAVLTTGEDITEKRKLEEQLRHAQKMEAVGHLAGGIAHDFNNITAIVMACGSVLQMKLAQDDPLRVYVEQILSASERATSLTRGLLTFSRKQVINPAPIRINEVVRRGGKLLSRLIGEDIELTTALSDEDPLVMADGGQMEQVIINLATNARDAMPGGGSLAIGTGLVSLDREFVKAHGFGAPGRYALVSVSDSGHGMDEKTKESMFEPFFTTKEVGKGTGLGLSIVYGIVKQHNGAVEAVSEPGAGTTFNIYLPLARPAPDDTATATSEAPPRGTETVLVAEDDAVFRKIMKELLEEYGYRVVAAADGEDAVDKFMMYADDIHLLILDVIMPRLNGKEVYDILTAARPDVKALFMSGYTDDIIHRKGTIDPGLNFISKPATPYAMLKKVRDVLDKK